MCCVCCVSGEARSAAERKGGGVELLRHAAKRRPGSPCLSGCSSPGRCCLCRTSSTRPGLLPAHYLQPPPPPSTLTTHPPPPPPPISPLFRISSSFPARIPHPTLPRMQGSKHRTPSAETARTAPGTKCAAPSARAGSARRGSARGQAAPCGVSRCAALGRGCPTTAGRASRGRFACMQPRRRPPHTP